MRPAIEAAPIGITVTDFKQPDNPIVYANDRFLELTGYAEEAVLGRNCRFLQGDQTATEAIAEFRVAIDERRPTTVELRNYRKDGSMFWNRVSIAPISDGDGTVENWIGFQVDITDRKERELELREYRRLVDEMQEAAAIYDLEGRFRTVNEYLAEFYDTTPEALEGTASSLIPAIRDAHPDDPWEALIAGEREIVAGEIEGEFPNAGYEVLQYRLSPIAADGEVQGVVGVAHEITEERAHSQRLEALQAQTQALMNTETVSETARVGVETARTVLDAPVSGVHVLDESGTVLEPVAFEDDGGSIFEEPPGYRRGDTNPASELIWDVYQTGEQRLVSETADQSPLDEASPVESGIVHPLGEYGVFVVSAPEAGSFDRTDATLVEILATSLTNALDRVSREKALREREQTLRQLHEITDDLIDAEDRDEVAKRVVDAATEILEFPIVIARYYDAAAGGLVPVAATEELRDRIGERPVLGPDSGSRNWAAYESGEEQVYDDISTHESDVGVDLELGSFMILPLGRHGTLSAASPATGDFDEADLALARVLASTTAAVLTQLEQEREVARQRDELRRQNERLEEFASVVSHDLRNPLNVAAGRVELAADDTDSEHLEQARTALDRMRTLIDDLLAFAREGETVQNPELVALDELVEACWQTVETATATLHVATNVEVRADRNRLRQLLENLLRNAVEHGGTEVAVTIGATEDGAGFYVADDGPGVSADAREDVIETGYTTTTDGTGFGLAIVKEIADAHGWEMALTDSAAGGLRVEFRGVETG
ncbi:MAG: PAS domain S-box protein [Halodesulfurarchaeum sp.]